MRAFVVDAPGVGAPQDVAMPTPGHDEIVVRVEYCGICGTDAHLFSGDQGGMFPRVLGHEIAGQIAAIGGGVGEWAEGDRIAVDPNIACGRCAWCRRRELNKCDRFRATGVTEPGGMAEYVTVPVSNVYRVEPHESLAHAALTEPLACAVQGVQRLAIEPAHRVLVFGAGPMGALLLALMARRSVVDMIVVDVIAERLACMAQFGASATLLNGPELADELAERSHGRGFDIVVDCTGVASVIESMTAHAAQGAQLLVFGVSPRSATIKLNPYDILRNEWTIVGSYAINGTFQQARELLASGSINVGPLVTRTVGLDEVASLLTSSTSSADLKILVAPHQPKLGN